jgi:proteasome accessory factor B
MPSPTKTQRWLDLIAFLVARRYPVTVEEIIEGVPPYAADQDPDDETARASLRRKFERDKKELRELGIPIQTVDVPGAYGADPGKAYRLAGDDFYLPYVRLIASGGEADPGGGPPDRPSPGRPARPDARGTFELREDEARAALEALHRVAELPSFPFRREARSAVRKLTFDLGAEGLGAAHEPPVRYLPPPGSEDLRDRLRLLSDALLRRKAVRFRYRGMHRDDVTRRHVHPYGLLFQHSHWYLIGHDVDRAAIRVFRLGRMEPPEANAERPRTPDYEVPGDFRLGAFADRPPWALAGQDDEPLEVRVRFAFPRSLWAERNRHGERVEDLGEGAQLRRFAVQDTGPFLRWMLTLGGDATIERPAALQDDLAALARTIARRHEGSAGANAGANAGADPEADRG